MDISWYGKNNRVYAKDAVLTPIGRVSFPSLVEARKREFQGNETEAFEFSILLDKNDPEVQAFEADLLALSKEMVQLYNQKKPDNLPKLGDVDNVFKDGNKANLEKYPMQEGMHVLIARNSKRPEVIDKAGDVDPQLVKAGMKVRAYVTPHFGGTGISYRAELLQVVEDDGVRFGGSRPDYKSLIKEINEDNASAPAAPEPETPAPAAQAEPAKKLSLAEQQKQKAEANVKNRAVGGKGLAAAKSLL